MIEISRDICQRFREARRQKRWSQSDLAKLVGCKQSQISMFEQGMVTKLAGETVRKIASELSVSLEAEPPPSPSAAVPDLEVAVAGGYCPYSACPSNLPYLVGERLFFRPARLQPGKFCAHCGEVLETRCPACGAALNAGACCAVCGSSYVAAVPPVAADPAGWARTRRELSRELGCAVV